ncbi:peptidase S9 [bacterium (candidate division B38) B3_B38]|nr:MAG: peptidase S9 [bacterium (candidate division B38) B3_B38]
MVFTLCIILPSIAYAQGTKEDYERAEKFLPANIKKYAFKLRVEPHWIEDSDSFWYKNDTRDGKEFLFVDPVHNIRRPAFDHSKLAAALTLATGTEYPAKKLPFESFEFIDEGKAIQFEVEKTTWKCDLATYKCAKVERKERRPDELPSPDGRWIAFVKNFNLYVRSADTGEEIQLSHDGEALYDYATPLPSPDLEVMVKEGKLVGKVRVAAIWSPDSKKLLSHRIDQRNIGRFHLLQSVPPEGGLRPVLYSYAYPLPGDKVVPVAELVIFDVEKRAQVAVDSEPLPLLYYGSPLMGWSRAYNRIQWSEDSHRIYFPHIERGYKALKLRMTDAETGQAQTVVEERAATYMDSYVSWKVRIMNGGSEVIWFSERDGWGHLYLYDGKTGELKNQITKGQWVVREVLHVDEKGRWVYFTAGGREEGRDPYYRHLYRIKLDGSHLELLTPEDAEHEVTFSPTGRYFVDTYSRVNMAPVSVLRGSPDGGIVRELEKADLELLLAMGWWWPEPFRTKARDGKTDIYGALFRPSNFDPEKKYPVLDYIYGGPSSVQTPKALNDRGTLWDAQAIAELGFLVVTIDGLGMPYRSKAFHDVSYKNLGDAGIEDHIAALRQLATRYSYIDLSRVGIFGHSAGGYSSTHAILAYADFFKVAVSSAGNHDHRLDKAVWIEHYMGSEVEDHYREQANSTIAHQLKGKLLLVHGDLDQNVHPYSTIQLVDALIKANKDFDLLIFPNRNHSLGRDPYFIRKRWDYFVKHLLGVEPPKEYKIQIEPQ